MAINMVVLDDENGFSSYIFGKKSPVSESDQAAGLGFLSFQCIIIFYTLFMCVSAIAAR